MRIPLLAVSIGIDGWFGDGVCAAPVSGTRPTWLSLRGFREMAPRRPSFHVPRISSPAIFKSRGTRTGFHFGKKRSMVPPDFAAGKVILLI
jgi:hypothetical protein